MDDYNVDLLPCLITCTQHTITYKSAAQTSNLWIPCIKQGTTESYAQLTLLLIVNKLFLKSISELVDIVYFFVLVLV